MRLIERVQPIERAVDVDRLLPARLAQQADDPLGLAERIGADQVGALGELLDRAQQPGDLVACVGVPEHRQAEGGLGDEDVAGDRLEG